MFLLLRVTSKASDHLQDCDPCVDFVHLVFEARVDLGSRTARCPRSPCTSGSWAPSPWSPWSPWAPSPWSTWAPSSWSPWWTSPQLSSPRWPPVCRRGNGWRPPRLCTLSLLLCLVRPHNNHCEGLIVSFHYKYWNLDIWQNMVVISVCCLATEYHCECLFVSFHYKNWNLDMKNKDDYRFSLGHTITAGPKVWARTIHIPIDWLEPQYTFL